MKKIEYTNYKKPSDYMTFLQGDNQIQILTSGGIGKFHGSRMNGRFINLGECQGENCPHCKNGSEPKTKWRWIIADLATNEIRVLDAGPMIGNQICEIAREKGDPQEYALIVNKTGDGLKAKYIVRAGGVKAEMKEEWKITKAFLIKKYFG